MQVSAGGFFAAHPLSLWAWLPKAVQVLMKTGQSVRVQVLCHCCVQMQEGSAHASCLACANQHLTSHCEPLLHRVHLGGSALPDLPSPDKTKVWERLLGLRAQQTPAC